MKPFFAFLYIGIFLMVAGPSIAFGDEYVGSEFDRMVYQNIVRRCSGDTISLAQGLQFVDSMKDSFSAAVKVGFQFEASPLKQLWLDKGLTRTTAEILNSAGFYQALRTCFPTSEARRNRFAFLMILADAAGREVGTIQGMLAFIYSGRIFTGAISKAYDVLRTTRFGIKLNIADKEKHLRYFGAAVATALVSMQIFNLRSRNNQMQKQEIQQRSEYETSLANIYQQLKITYLTIAPDLETPLNCSRIADFREMKSLFLDLEEQARSIFAIKKFYDVRIEIENINYNICKESSS